ncbi:MAG: heavy metal-binding domain-containing protein [Lutibacter sp.]|nr:heavy metal-binding domain-containing protein [Lutibacter sp.]
MILTTTNTIETHQIKEYLGIVTGETIVGANVGVLMVTASGTAVKHKS